MGRDRAPAQHEPRPLATVAASELSQKNDRGRTIRRIAVVAMGALLLTPTLSGVASAQPPGPSSDVTVVCRSVAVNGHAYSSCSHGRLTPEERRALTAFLSNLDDLLRIRIPDLAGW